MILCDSARRVRVRVRVRTLINDEGAHDPTLPWSACRQASLYALIVLKQYTMEDAVLVRTWELSPDHSSAACFAALGAASGRHKVPGREVAAAATSSARIMCRRMRPAVLSNGHGGAQKTSCGEIHGATGTRQVSRLNGGHQ